MAEATLPPVRTFRLPDGRSYRLFDTPANRALIEHVSRTSERRLLTARQHELATSRRAMRLSAEEREEANRTACHEAGHAVAGYLEGLRPTAVWTAGRRGEAQYEHFGTAFTSVAGAVAEEICGWARGHLSEPDRDHAYLHLGTTPHTLGAGRRLEALKQQARQRLRRYRPAIEALADALLASPSGELGGDEIERIIKGNTP